jgi:hypothetical protein
MPKNVEKELQMNIKNLLNIVAEENALTSVLISMCQV